MPTKKAAPYRNPLYRNKLFPGLPHYTGPNKGWFAFLHHRVLFEQAEYSGVRERVAHVANHKPVDERTVRLQHMMYLGPKLCKLLDKSGNPTGPKYRKQVMAYIEKNKPDHTWRDGGLHKANGELMTG